MDGNAQDYISDLLAKAENGETLTQVPAEGESGVRAMGESNSVPTFEGTLPSDPTQPRLNKNGTRQGCYLMDGARIHRTVWEPKPYNGDTSKIHEARPDELPEFFAARFKNEKHEHRLCAYLKAEGYSNTEIAERMGFTKVHVGNILRLPWVREVIREAITAAGQDRVRALLASTAEDSIHCLIAVRDDPNARNSDKISAARELLDRQYGRAAQLTVHATTQDLEKMSDDELTKIARGNITSN